MNKELRKLIQELGIDRYSRVSYDYKQDKWEASTDDEYKWEYATGDTPEEALRNLIKEPIL